MSGIALITSQDDAPIDPVVLQRMMGRLAHRGVNGCRTWSRPSLAIGHQHFWTTPEEVGERQPLTRGSITIAFDGRLDNRPTLLAALGHNAAEARTISDAALVLQAYQRWGTDCLTHLLGPFAVVIDDSQRNQTICARDPVGDRTLYYHRGRGFVLVASEEQALLAHTAVPTALDEDTLANYFAAQERHDGRTMFAAIKEIQPGMLLTIGKEGVQERRYWEYTPPAEIRYRTDEAYAAHFLALLQASVRSRLRAVTLPAVLMSGGMDSTSVAAVAAGMTAAPLTTISWVYADLKGPDERVFIDACNAHLHTEPLLIYGDDAWPLSSFETWPVNPNHPTCDPYERLNERAYQAASGRPLLTGLFGDNLYSSAEYWLFDLLRERRVGETLRLWRHHARGEDWYFARTDPGLRRLGREILNRLPGGHKIRPPQPPQRPWLTTTANRRLRQNAVSSPPVPAAVRRPAQFRSLYNARNARAAIATATNAVHFGVDIRHPYRDRRLLEFALAIPAHQLYQGRLFKHIARTALRHLLPESVRLRTHESSFTPLFQRGVAELELDHVWQLLGKADAGWQKFVTSDLIPLQTVDDLKARLYELSSIELIIVWNCVAFELWRSRSQTINQKEWSNLMPTEDKSASNDQPITEKTTRSRKLPYQPPTLENLGDIRDVTLGGSPGTADSGNSQTGFAPRGGRDPRDGRDTSRQRNK